MIELFTILASIGATLIITKSYLFEKFRESFKTEFFHILFHCPQCSGFWIGFIFGILVSPILNFSFYCTILYIFGNAFITSGICEIIQNKLYDKDEY